MHKFTFILVALVGVAGPVTAQRVPTSDESSAGTCWNLRTHPYYPEWFTIFNDCEYAIFVGWCIVYLEGGIPNGSVSPIFLGDACRPGPNAGSEIDKLNTVAFRRFNFARSGTRKWGGDIYAEWGGDSFSGYQQIEIWAGACRGARITFEGKQALEFAYVPTVADSDGERPTSYTCEHSTIDAPEDGIFNTTPDGLILRFPRIP